jgi:hypothetical protein
LTAALLTSKRAAFATGITGGGDITAMRLTVPQFAGLENGPAMFAPLMIAAHRAALEDCAPIIILDFSAKDPTLIVRRLSLFVALARM